MFEMIQQLRSQVSCCLTSKMHSNYDGDTCQIITSVDCWVLVYRSQTSCFSHNSQRFFQVDWYVSFWGSKRLRQDKNCIVFWESTASFNNFIQQTLQAQVDYWYYFNNIKSFAATCFERLGNKSFLAALHPWMRSNYNDGWFNFWGGMYCPSHFQCKTFQVDCYLHQEIQNIPSLSQRLQNVLWGRMGEQSQQPKHGFVGHSERINLGGFNGVIDLIGLVSLYGPINFIGFVDLVVLVGSWVSMALLFKRISSTLLACLA